MGRHVLLVGMLEFWPFVSRLLKYESKRVDSNNYSLSWETTYLLLCGGAEISKEKIRLVILLQKCLDGKSNLLEDAQTSRPIS